MVSKADPAVRLKPTAKQLRNFLVLCRRRYEALDRKILTRHPAGPAIRALSANADRTIRSLDNMGERLEQNYVWHEMFVRLVTLGLGHPDKVRTILRTQQQKMKDKAGLNAVAIATEELDFINRFAM